MSEFSARISDRERMYVAQVLDSEFRSSSGAVMMKRLEWAFAERFGTSYAISFINGTATMHAALEALHLSPGDEVIVPPLTMSATTFAVLQANATPIFADVEEDTFQISASDVQSKITSRTKAVITVGLYGLSPDMDAIRDACKSKGIRIIEDNAECFLGTYKGRIAGTSGDCASFSFQSSKHMTSGEGGMIITDDSDLADEIRRIQSLGYAGVGAATAKITKKDIQNPDYMRHTMMGWNYRMPELCAAVALGQLEHLDELVSRRISVAQQFGEVAASYPELLTPQYTPPECTNSYWTWVCKLNTDIVSWLDFRDTFVSNGGDGIYSAWQLTYLEPMFAQLNLLGRERFIERDILESYASGLCPVAERLQPMLLQFKTNYWQYDLVQNQVKALRATLEHFQARL